jgi:membrane protein DedA with SNARE-associated domain
MPGLAGTAKMHYPRFLAFNAAGGVVWGTGFVLIGYAAGASYQRVEKVAGRASTGILIVVVLALAANALRLRRKERRGEGTEPYADDEPAAGDERR